MTARLLGATLFGAGLIALPAAGIAQDNFYANNNIRIVVGYSPGGSNDTYARIVANHLGRHIPGEPNIIVENMPGAGSLTAVRSLDATFPSDGSVIVAFNPGLVMGGLTDPENVQVDFNDYAFLGTLSQVLGQCYTLSGGGVETYEDMVAADEFIVGATGPGTLPFTYYALLQNLLGIDNLRPIVGFTGSADIVAALERGEVDGYCATWAGVPANIIAMDEFRSIIRMSDIDDPLLADAPYIGDLIEDEEDLEVLRMVEAGDQVGTPYIVSHAVPEERLAILRAGFEAMVADPAFLAEAERVDLPIMFNTGEEAQRIVAELYASDPEMVERMRAAMELE